MADNSAAVSSANRAEALIARRRAAGGKPNRLIGEGSPYLLQHAYNPVDWYPWGNEAFAAAAAADKPLFVSIGYSTCHWCHVMEHESFEDEATAAVLNEHFVNVKIDREERPDVDHIYMTVVQAVTGCGGWPMSVFLTPGRQPFYAGTCAAQPGAAVASTSARRSRHRPARNSSTSRNAGRPYTGRGGKFVAEDRTRSGSWPPPT